jgi:hypothetical protein
VPSAFLQNSMMSPLIQLLAPTLPMVWATKLSTPFS